MIFTTLMIILIFLTLTAVTVGFLLLYFKSGETPGDKSIIYNFMTKYVPSATGVQIKRFSGPYREAILMRKFDKSYLDLFRLKKKDKSEDYMIYFNEEQITTFSKGTLSPDRDIIFILPPHPEDLPEEFRESSIGKAISLVIENKDYDKKLNELLREYSDRKDNILKNWAGGEISPDLLEHMDTMFMDVMKTTIKEKDNPRNSGGMLPPSNNYGGN